MAPPAAPQHAADAAAVPPTAAANATAPAAASAAATVTKAPASAATAASPAAGMGATVAAEAGGVDGVQHGGRAGGQTHGSVTPQTPAGGEGKHPVGRQTTHMQPPMPNGCMGCTPNAAPDDGRGPQECRRSLLDSMDAAANEGAAPLAGAAGPSTVATVFGERHEQGQQPCGSEPGGSQGWKERRAGGHGGEQRQQLAMDQEQGGVGQGVQPGAQQQAGSAKDEEGVEGEEEGEEEEGEGEEEGKAVDAGGLQGDGMANAACLPPGKSAAASMGSVGNNPPRWKPGSKAKGNNLPVGTVSLLARDTEGVRVLQVTGPKGPKTAGYQPAVSLPGFVVARSTKHDVQLDMLRAAAAAVPHGVWTPSPCNWIGNIFPILPPPPAAIAAAAAAAVPVGGDAAGCGCKGSDANSGATARAACLRQWGRWHCALSTSPSNSAAGCHWSLRLSCQASRRRPSGYR